MASLFQRIVGDLTPEEAGAGAKIALHAFCGALNELRRGKITLVEFISFFNLDPSQQSQLLTFRDLLLAAPNKMEFLRVFKDLMYMGECDLDPRYKSAATTLARLQEEVTDQGGTLP